jgi:hypothetical protein
MSPILTDPATAPRETITAAQYRAANVAYFFYANKIRGQLNADHPHLIFDVNPTIALDVTVATYDDIDRYKSYHLRNTQAKNPKSDAVKRAAYFAKWTSKFRPIFYTPNGPPIHDPKSLALLANETLAAAYAIDLIGEELDKSLKLSNKAYHDLLYDLHFRDMSDSALLALFQVYWDLASSGKPNPVIEVAVI